MRVMFVAPYLPTPGSGGRTRLMNLMARHARRHEVSLVALAPPDQDPAAVPYPGATVPYPYPHRSPGWRGTLEFYRERFAQPLPLYAYHARVSGFAEAVRREAEQRAPDLVQFEHPETGQYFAALPAGPLKAIDFHDVASRWLAREAAKPIRLREKAFLRLELAKTRRYERGIARAAHTTIVCSELERAELRRISGIDAVVAPNGVDAQAFEPMPRIEEDHRRLLYVGPMKYPANADAVRWFAADILPRIREQSPDAYLDVVGLPSNEHFPGGVRQLGKVPDIRPEYARAAILVVPIRAGTGTRYKILEALAMERAVVSTTVGAEGIGAQHREHLLIADGAEEFAAAVVELLRSPELRARLGAGGRRLVALRYDWGPIVDAIEASWERALASRRADTR